MNRIVNTSMSLFCTMSEAEAKPAPRPITVPQLMNSQKIINTDFFHHPIPRGSDPSIRQRLDNNTQQCLRYLSRHVDELLQLVFEETPTLVGTRAYRVFQHGDSELVAPIISQSLLQVHASRIVHRNPIQPLCIARLCGLTLTTVRLNSEKIDQACGFVFQLLPFIDVIAVYELFETLLGPSRHFRDAQKWLESVNFYQIVLQEMKATNPADPKMRSFYSLLRGGKKSELMSKHFANCQVISALCVKNEYWKDERWDALASLYCPATKTFLRSQLMEAVEVVKEKTPKVTRRVIAALGLLTKMVKEDQEMHQFFTLVKFAGDVVDLMERFPEHNILCGTVYRFANAVFAVDDLAAVFVPELVPRAMKHTTPETFPGLRFACYRILNSARNTSLENPKLKALLASVAGWEEFSEKKLVQYWDFTKTSYGQAENETEKKKTAKKPQVPGSIQDDKLLDRPANVVLKEMENPEGPKAGGGNEDSPMDDFYLNWNGPLRVTGEAAQEEKTEG